MLPLLFALFSLSLVSAQQAGTQTAESHPPLSISICSNSSGCQTASKSVVLDANWRWTHSVSGYDNCYTGNSWNKQYCPDPQTCSKNCAVDGADYGGTYGIHSTGQSLSLTLVTQGPYSKNIGSRVYLYDEASKQYELFKLKNREFSFDADVSQLPCGLNGALYFVQMPANGGKGMYPLNSAGAAYGTGYCDAQCPRDIKFINGEANVLDWTPSPDDPNSGTGLYGSCCAEMDIWEANSQATAYTAHPCSTATAQRCQGDAQCGDGSSRYNGFCDKDGCDFNSFRNGVKDFFGQGLAVNTRSPVTVVTQFFTADGSDTGPLSEIRRKYIQNGRVLSNTKVLVPNVKPYDSLSDSYCTDIKKAFGDPNDFATKGGMKAFSAALDKGMVLVMSLWDDYTAYMLWLDSNYPTNKSPLTPGVARGNCSTSSGRPKDVESQYPNARVVFSNIRFGQIGSTTR